MQKEIPVTVCKPMFAYGYVPIQNLPVEETILYSPNLSKKEREEKRRAFNKYPIARHKKPAQGSRP